MHRDSRIEFAAFICGLPFEIVYELAKGMPKALRRIRGRKRAKGYNTLHPGDETPLWNVLRAELRPWTSKYGTQVNLGRFLGLPRQRVNAFLTRGTEMPDAERTLMMVVWLMAARKLKRPPG